jgi:hypothetical protein
MKPFMMLRRDHRIAPALLIPALLCAIFVVLYAPPARAQSDALGAGATISISLSPNDPGPDQAVHLTAQSSGIDLSQAQIIWSVDGKTVAQGTGVDSADITTGALGTETDVGADAQMPDGTTLSAQAAIIPTELDLLVDSDSYVPPFYLGRALPAADTDLRLQAIPYFMRPDGSTVAAGDITYTWKRDGEVMEEVSGRGKSNVIVAAPPLFGTDTISVEAHSSDGALSGAAAVSVPSVEPALVLYEDHPLYGILYGNALGTSNFIPEAEMTFAAVPYFAEAQNPNDPGLDFAWSVNDAAVAPSPASPSEITINASDSSGVALVALELTRPDNFYMDAQGSWNITFSGGAAGQNQSSSFGQ